MKYIDQSLQRHELDYWLNHNYPNKHADFYKEFFDFSLCFDKSVLDVGCGGNPIIDFVDVPMQFSILDPLLNSLILSQKYNSLSNLNGYSMSILDFDELNKFDIITCLNVIDHFTDHDAIFIDKFYQALKQNGELWLYYDVRPVDACDHLAVDNNKILTKLSEKFEISKISNQINPKHEGWSGITESVRLIARKK